jgi:molybdenum storage protein
MLDRDVLTDAVLDSLPATRRQRLLPDVTVLKIGGQSVMDRGAEAVLPVVEQIAAARGRVPMIVCAGAGTRARHAYHIGLDLGLSAGVLAKLGGSVSRQNARMLQMLLSRAGAVLVPPEHFEQLPAFLAAGQLPIMSGMPPYEFWMRPPAVGRIPETRSDAGVFLLAETVGAHRLIFVKDEDTVFDTDPKKNPRAKPLATGVASEIRRMHLPDFVVEPVVLEFLERARFIREFTLVSALVPGQLADAIAGKAVGTRIHAGQDGDRATR